MKELQPIPPFSVRISKRAKRVLLKVSSPRELEIVIPVGFDPRYIPGIIQRKSAWITRAFNKAEHFDAPKPVFQFPPTEICLRALDKTFSLAYHHSPAAPWTLSPSSGPHLDISGNMSNNEGCRPLLKQWLKNQGRHHLVPLLENLSSETGLNYKQVRIRSQKTRWGSCSGKKNINLNCKLLFLPNEKVRYVLKHELAHTVFLNHSPAFWDLVAELDPRYKANDLELKEAWRYVPGWVDR